MAVTSRSPDDSAVFFLMMVVIKYKFHFLCTCSLLQKCFLIHNKSAFVFIHIPNNTVSKLFFVFYTRLTEKI